jgi:uncharacterized protein (TIGR02284 family)
MSKQENKELGKLININEDACEFYESASEKAENPQMKKTFANLEELHKGVVIDLKNRVRANGGDPEAEETFTGKAQKFWGELMANISNDVDETLVKHLEEAEDRCLHSMQDAIQDNEIGTTTKAVLQSQFQTLQQSHDHMKALKENMKEAA